MVFGILGVENLPDYVMPQVSSGVRGGPCEPVVAFALCFPTPLLTVGPHMSLSPEHQLLRAETVWELESGR